MLRWSNYIGGQDAAPVEGARLDVYEPATGQVYADIPRSTHADVDAAVAAALQAAPAWMATTPDHRSRLLLRIAELIEAQAETLAALESRDNGKPLRLAREVDIPRAAANFRFFASAATQFASESHHLPGITGYTLRQPIGLVGCISPWNLPLYLFTWKIAPALAAGNVVIGKPSEVTPATAVALGAICTEAGLPAGVLNIVHGTGAETGAAIVKHPLVKAISFTGGTQTGATIAALAAPQFKKLSLELGGKNPVLIFDDANYEQALDTTLRSAFSNQGQICLCGSRILIQQSIYDKFKRDFVARAQALKVGDPLLPATHLGAIVSAQHHRKILDYIQLAQQEGADVLCGGHEVHVEGRCTNGWFVAPTVLEGLPNTCRTNQEEIFGPVVTLQPFADEQEALALANDVPYGLAAVVWTTDLSRAQRLAHHLEAGIIWVNCWMVRDLRTPFGGVKASGVGREGGFEAMRFFTEAKSVTIAWDTI